MNKDLVLFIVWLVFPMAIVLMLFGIRYFKNKENMALIARGKDIDSKTNSENLFTWAMVLIGASLGLLIGMVINGVLSEVDHDPILIYLMCFSLFIGFGLLLSYNRRKKGDKEN